METHKNIMKKLFLGMLAIGAFSLLSFNTVTKPETLWRVKCSNGSVYYFTCDCSQGSANVVGSSICSASNP